jgi:hypothetical protein
MTHFPDGIEPLSQAWRALSSWEPVDIGGDRYIASDLTRSDETARLGTAITPFLFARHTIDLINVAISSGASEKYLQIVQREVDRLSPNKKSPMVDGQWRAASASDIPQAEIEHAREYLDLVVWLDKWHNLTFEGGLVTLNMDKLYEKGWGGERPVTNAELQLLLQTGYISLSWRTHATPSELGTALALNREMSLAAFSINTPIISLNKALGALRQAEGASHYSAFWLIVANRMFHTEDSRYRYTSFWMPSSEHTQNIAPLVKHHPLDVLRYVEAGVKDIEAIDALLTSGVTHMDSDTLDAIRGG